MYAYQLSLGGTGVNTDAHLSEVEFITRVQRHHRQWGTITRNEVIDAATSAVIRGDYEQMTIRSLAAALDVAPMSLYRHVRNRDDLLDEVVERLLVRRWRPRVDPTDWVTWVIEAADKLRNLLVKYPAALHVYLRHPVVSPTAIKRMEMMLDVLRTAGMDDDEAFHAYATVHTYTVGFAALEAGRSRQLSEQPVDGADPIATRLAEFVSSQQFADGLGYILRGVVSSAPDHSPSVSPVAQGRPQDVGTRKALSKRPSS